MQVIDEEKMMKSVLALIKIEFFLLIIDLQSLFHLPLMGNGHFL